MNATGIFYKLLKDDAAVAAIIGEKIYPVKLPQGVALPAAVVSVVAVSPILSKDAVSDEDFVRVQVSSYATTYKQAHELDNAIRAALDNYDGSVVAGLETWDVKNIQYLNGNDVFEMEKEVFHRASDYEIHGRLAVVGTVTWRWELEDGSGFWLLEDGSGYWLQEAA